MHFATLAIAPTSVKHQGAPECSPDQRVDPAQTLTKKWYLPEDIAARTRRAVTILPDRHHEVLFDLCPGDARHLRHGWEEAVLHPEHLSGGTNSTEEIYYNYMF